MQVLAHVHLIRKLRLDALAEMCLHVFLMNHLLEFHRKIWQKSTYSTNGSNWFIKNNI